MMNPFRDDTIVTLCGQRLVLRPTFEALAEMEGATGRDLVDLARHFARGAVTLRQLEAVLTAGIRGAGGKIPADLGGLLLREGTITVMRALGEWLAAVFAGDKDSSEEDQAQGKA